MDILRRKAILLFTIIALLLSQHLLFADDQFNEFATSIYKKDIEGVRALLDKGVDVNMRQKTMGSTPLMVACSIEGTYEIVELLISKGADVNAIGSYDGRTPLIWAAANSKKNVKLLLAKGAEVNVKGVEGMTAFINSIFGILSNSVTIEVCDLLLVKGADVNDQLTGGDFRGAAADLPSAIKPERIDVSD